MGESSMRLRVSELLDWIVEVIWGLCDTFLYITVK